MYYRPETNEIFANHSEIRSASRNVLYPDDMDDDMLAFNGVYPLAYALPPVEAGQIAEPATVEEVDGVWTQTWTVRDATPEELAGAPVPVPYVPEEVSAGQAREALYNAGLLDRVQPAIDAIPDADTRWRAQNAWEHRPTVQRHSPTVALLAGALSLDDAALDQLFITAAGL